MTQPESLAQHTIRLPPDLMGWVEGRAAKFGRSKNQEIALLLNTMKQLEDNRKQRAAARTAAHFETQGA